MTTADVTITESGTITEIKRGIVRLSGLPSCVQGQLLELGSSARGLVIGFTETEVLALVLGADAGLAVGQRIQVRQQPLRLSIGPQWLGRLVSPLGEPLDGAPPPAGDAREPVFCEAPGILDRAPVERQLVTGIRAIDAMIPLGRGQRELIIGDRMTGKTTLALDAMLAQRDQQVLCVYCSIGQSHQKLRYVGQFLRERGLLPSTVVVAATAARSASEQFLAPYSACAVGEYFMSRGRDVLVVFDDLSKHAWAYRQLSLLLERPPGREAYPGDMFFIHSQFMERAAQLGPRRGGGSMTFLPICETQQGDVTGYICSNLISMTDGQIYLSSDLMYEGLKPAIDAGLSVSRIGNKVQPPLFRWAAGGLRLDLLQHQELVRLTRFSSDGSTMAAPRYRRGALLRRLMTQPAHQPMALADQVVLSCAFKTGWLERLTEEGLRRCMTRPLSDMLPAFAREALLADAATPAVLAKVETGLEAVLRPWCREEGVLDARAATLAQ